MSIFPPPIAPPAPTPVTSTLGFAVLGGPRATEAARGGLAAAASELLVDDCVRDLLLLGSELVNNAVQHGGGGRGGTIAVRIWATPTRVGVEVADPGPGFEPAPRAVPLDEPGGWGLVLVDRIAASWGVVADDMTRVWFELARARA